MREKRKKILPEDIATTQWTAVWSYLSAEWNPRDKLHLHVLVQFACAGCRINCSFLTLGQGKIYSCFISNLFVWQGKNTLLFWFFYVLNVAYQWPFESSVQTLWRIVCRGEEIKVRQVQVSGWAGWWAGWQALFGLCRSSCQIWCVLGVWLVQPI